MGELIDGRWYSSGKAKEVQNPPRRPAPTTYPGVVVPSGSGGAGDFIAEPGRYHLYVSLACPWAGRTTIMRRLKGLEAMIGMSVVNWHVGEDGWTFAPGPGVVADDVNGAIFLRDVYLRDNPDATTRVSVPVLWDKRTNCIVSNESALIIRMFNSAFDSVGARPGDYYPSALRAEIDAVNDRIFQNLNAGVYRAGFAFQQEEYAEAATTVFETLDWLDKRLGRQRYLLGSSLTEADIRLFTTLVRFDSVYFGHFKCNLRALTDYPALWDYTRDLYQHPDFGATVDFDHIKRHYYTSHPWINPNGIVPVGPILNFDEPTREAGLP